MHTFNRKAVHAALYDAAVEVYEARGVVTTAGAVALDMVAEARASLEPAAFALWVTAELGSGGKPSADDYVVGSLPAALRANGYMANRAPTKQERIDGHVDDCAVAVNVFVSRLRIIGHKAAADPAFTFADSFRKTYDAAHAKGSGSNASATATAPDKSAEKPSAAVVVTAELGRAWCESNPLDALDTLRRYLLSQKDVIRAATLQALVEQLSAEAKARIAAAEAAAKAAKQTKRAKRSA